MLLRKSAREYLGNVALRERFQRVLEKSRVQCSMSGVVMGEKNTKFPERNKM